VSDLTLNGELKAKRKRTYAGTPPAKRPGISRKGGVVPLKRAQAESDEPESLGGSMRERYQISTNTDVNTSTEGAGEAQAARFHSIFWEGNDELLLRLVPKFGLRV
jgi:hypothetical protein